MSGRTRVLYVDGAADDLDRVHTLPDGDVPVAETADTAAEAIDRVEAGGVDCVVFGGELPDATGVEFLHRLREIGPTVPCVLFVERSFDPTAAAAIETGATGYLHRNPGVDQTDALSEAVGTALDRCRERDLEATQERFRGIIEASSDVVSILDADGTFRYLSPSVEEVLGYEPSELVGQGAFQYVHPEDRDRVAREFATAVDDPDRTPDAEYRFRHADGSWRVVGSRGTNMIDDPVVEGVVVNTREVTDRRRRDQRMDVLNRTLRHDLRNAMNVILGNAELLMRDHGTDDRAEAIRRTAADMLELGNKVRDVERALDTGERSREMVDLVSVVEERLAAVERSEPEVTVEADLPESEWVLANRQIGSAVDDAIENAVEHNDADDPVVRVTVDEARLTGEAAVTLTVADNGPGIPEEELDVLTGGETPLEHTSGLGLWLIKWVVNESAGEIAFEESDLGGTVVRITLKRASVGQTIDLV
ncbi:hypothetical protein BRD00_06655 [Halobacteriales archaeon QS_8_69_26]|nr:MAG: hypothetical protein BRD00_06655 [Halobacteriales archaeon QS_8_69_26]